MIDWATTDATPETVRTLDKVTVICERCQKPRQITYNNAKQNSEHICMSCRKRKGQYVTGQMVMYKCVDCPKTQEQQYRPGRMEEWRCHHCAMVKAHRDGKLTVNLVEMTDEVKDKISAKAKMHWEDPEYRRKWKESRDKTKDKRSATSKAVWSDEERLQKLSESIKAMWRKSDYRNLKINQIIEQWQDDDYIKKQAEGMADPFVRKIISEASHRLWENNRDKMIEIIRCNLSNPEVIEKLRLAGIFNWQLESYRTAVVDGLMASWDEDKRKLAATSSAERWKNPQYRAKAILAIRQLMADPAVRKKLSESSKAHWAVPEYREKMAKARALQPRVSSIQEMLYRYLDDIMVDYCKEGPETAIGHYVFDCFVPTTACGKKLLIECQGDYWHILPRAISNDRSKFTYINRYFPEYEIMYVWEHEFYAEGRVLDRLKLKLGVGVETVKFDFNDIELKAPSTKEIKSFLDAYHYIGKDRGGVIGGAYHGDDLVACIVYSPPLRQNTAGQFGLNDTGVRELSRLCIHPRYHKKNFGSWFISRSLKSIGRCTVIAYADATVGHLGTVYAASNFTEHHRVPPDYWYIDDQGYVMHKRTLYGRAVKMKMIEADYAAQFGYIKKWGGEKICFVYQT